MTLALLVCLRPDVKYRSPFKRVPPGKWRVKFEGSYASVMVAEELGSPLSMKLTDGLEFDGAKSISIGFLSVHPQDKEITVSIEKVNGLILTESQG